jgi:HD-like signal output (HDOD) protein
MALEREMIVTLGSTLSPSLQVFARLGKLLEDPDTDIVDIVELVQVDPTLTFKILQLSNSVMFGMKHHCDVLEEAISLVGAREIQRIVGLAAAHQTYQGDLMTYGLPAGQLWENSVTTAAVMESLARRTGGDPRAAYTAGLLRNVGRVIIDKVKGGGRYPGEAAHPSVARWERGSYGIAAVEVSALLLDHWRFPIEMTEAVRLHLEPTELAIPPKGACLLNIAGLIAAELDAGLPGESVHWELTQEKLDAAGVDVEIMTVCGEEAREMLATLNEAVGSLKLAA